jgi:nucleotide-binding universal stress UspA family protein
MRSGTRQGSLWVVGIDFVGRSGGALHMAAWLKTHGREPQTMVGAHVLPDSARASMPIAAIEGATTRATEELHRVVAATGLNEPLDETASVWASSSEDGLSTIATRRGAMGIVIGRAAATDERALVRLGRVARRLLRALPVPVMVVPPDATLVLATDLDDESIDAAKTARMLATTMGRELLVACVDASLHEASMMAPDSGIPLVQYTPQRNLEDVAAWARAHELGDSEHVVARGERVTTLLRIAKEREAPMIVCGSRCLSPVQRIFASSTATDLARLSDRAVLVVPGRGR